jgi:L-lactate dehydrogenase
MGAGGAAKPKIAVIGVGAVGASFAFALMQSGLARELVLIDRNEDLAEGHAMDLNHGMPFTPPLDIRSGTYADCQGADIVVVTAGVPQRPGESRLELASRNAEIMRQIVTRVVEHAPEAVLLVVTNPLDVMTYAALKFSGFPRERVLGSGTVLDSSRLRFLLSRHCGVDARNIHAYIIGEHGDSEVPVWSGATIGGLRLLDFCPFCERACEPGERERIFEQVVRAAYEIIDRKGATYYAVALAMVRICQAILRDERSILTVSTLIEGHYGVEGVCLSLPTVLGAAGAGRVIAPRLEEGEEEGFRRCGRMMRDIIDGLGL